MIPPGASPTMEDIHQAVSRFYHEHKMKPSVVRMNAHDSSNFLKNMFNIPPVVTLEDGKKYANYVQTCCGPVRLDLLEEDDTVIQGGYHSNSNGMASSSLIVVENKELDEEFEKHVLNGGK